MPQRLTCAAHMPQHLMHSFPSHSAQLCKENNGGVVVMQEAQVDRPDEASSLSFPRDEAAASCAPSCRSADTPHGASLRPSAISPARLILVCHWLRSVGLRVGAM